MRSQQQQRQVADQGLAFFVLLLLLCCCQTRAERSTEPLMINDGPLTINERSSIRLACPGTGEIFWRLNNTFVTYRNSDRFSAVGFSVSSDLVTVFGSAGSNNTNVSCEWIQGGDNDVIGDVSGTATIVVLGAPSMPSVALTDETASTNSFTLSWSSPYSPPEFNITHYTVTITDTLNDMVYMPPVLEDSENSFTSLFAVPTSSLPLQLCSQFIFQVTASSVIGESAPTVITWENPESTGVLENVTAAEDVKCKLLYSDTRKTAYIQVGFLFPLICQFQNASYTVSVSEASKTDEGISEEGPIIHFGRNSREVLVVLGPLELGLLEGKDYSATVDIQGPTGSVLSAGSYCGVTVTDFATTPATSSTGGLNGNSKRPVHISGEVIGAIAVTAVVILIVVIVNIALLVVCLRARPEKSLL